MPRAPALRFPWTLLIEVCASDSSNCSQCVAALEGFALASSLEDPTAADAAELDDATNPLAHPEEETSLSEDSATADAEELGGAMDPMGDLHLDPDEAARFQDEAVRALSQTQQALLQAAADSADSTRRRARMSPSTHDQHRDRSRSPSRWRPSCRSESHSPSSDCSPGSPVLVGGQELPLDFLADMQDMLWPVKFHKRDRPADLLSFESSLSPTVRMAPLEATVSVAALILKLRQVALDRRVAEARRTSTFPVAPNSDAPLTYNEMGWVLEFWQSKFRERTLTQLQAAQDLMDGLNSEERRKRMRSRFYSYIGRALGNRKLGMALITMGFNVDLDTLASAYAQATADGDASCLQSKRLRKRVLSMRSWYRWGRQLFFSVESNKVAWESLGPTAKNAWRWYCYGWSAKECDRLTEEYGCGMLRTGPDRESFLGPQATGSVADRMRPEFL